MYQQKKFYIKNDNIAKAETKKDENGSHLLHMHFSKFYTKNAIKIKVKMYYLL